METSTFKAYLSDRYDDQIKWYDGKSRDNQKKYKAAQFVVIILSASTPVLIEFSGPGSFVELTHLATVTSVVVAILTTLLKTFKYQENWLTYRTTCETLKKEKYYFDFDLGEYASSNNKQALFVERVESLISRENTTWISSQKTETKPQKLEPAESSPSAPATKTQAPALGNIKQEEVK